MGCTIIGSGKALPAKAVSNDDLAHIVDTSDEWISSRTGIKTRRIATTESTTDLAVAAARAALGLAQDDRFSEVRDTQGWSQGSYDPKSIDLLICATISPDATVPSQAALVKARMGLDNAVAFDVNAACAGCVYGITLANSMMVAANASDLGATGNQIKRALVVGVERLSRLTNWNDRATCVLFGDGAGAVLLEWNSDRPGIMSTFLKNTDDLGFSLARSALYDDSSFCFGDANETNLPLPESPFIIMDGKTVFKFAGNALAEAAHAVLDRAQVAIDDIACIVPHQANERIIKYAAKKIGRPLELFQVSIAQTANTSAASALMALCDAYAAGKIASGDKVIVVGFGGGLTSGAVLFEA